MGEALHDIVLRQEATRCRIYAPVGAHHDLLAYLVRRLLENGANSSFVNQIVDTAVPAADVARCPFDALAATPRPTHPRAGPELFAPERRNALGFDLRADVCALADIDARRTCPDWLTASPLLAVPAAGSQIAAITNPATGERIGDVTFAEARKTVAAFGAAAPWAADGAARAAALERAADLYERDYGQAFAILAVEAGKHWPTRSQNCARRWISFGITRFRPGL